MKKITIIIITIFLISSCSQKNTLQDTITKNMNKMEGTIVFYDLQSNHKIIFNSHLTKTRTTPCSTFKIWNTLIGIENNLINSPKEPFYKWDGKKRSYSVWNRDLNLEEAFKFSCVPAYQNLARKIDAEKMKPWLEKINYGNKNISSGIDIFWLPRPNKKSILISPKEQAMLIRQLVNNQLPFSKKALQILKTIMKAKQTDSGTIYAKTGTGKNVSGIKNNNIGWYVGYIISKNGKYSFACLLKGKTVTSKNAKVLVERILVESKLL